MCLRLQCRGVGLERGLGHGVVREVRWSISDIVVCRVRGVIAPVARVKPCLML
jgi:hypothetical protein